MRVRVIRPAYWTDADLHNRLSADVREFYIGLWMLADDEGFVTWDPERIGAELYPYQDPRQRVDNITGWAADLGDHVHILDCRRHLVVPNLAKHQVVPRPSANIRRDHDRTCVHMAPRATTNGHVEEGGTTSLRREEKRKEEKRESKKSPPDENSNSEFRAKMAAEGYTP